MEFQLDLCGGEIQYQDLLEYLSVPSKGGNDEANILAEFYSHSKKPKEMEEAFTDKLQLLAHKVISKKPNFHNNLDTTLKQHYTNQLYDHNSTSITKTLLIQMPKVTFTQFRNELAKVLGTCQHFKGSTKLVSVSSVGAESGEEETPLKSQQKCKAKMSAQSSQIRDLHGKLDFSHHGEFPNMGISPILVHCKWQLLTHYKLLNLVVMVMETTQVTGKVNLS